VNALRYDYPFDPDAPNNTAASIYRIARAGGPAVLDIGSGPAIVSRALASADGKKVTCVDLDAAALEAAEEAGLETHVVDLGSPRWHEPLDGRTYDVVILADVLEHLRDPERVLRDLRERRLVADDGMLVISIPNAAHEAVLAELLLGDFRYTETGLLDSTHIRWYTLTSISRLLASCGYLVVETHRTLRTLEQTPTGFRSLQLEGASRQLLASLGEEARTYQYILRVAPSDAGPQLAVLHERLDEAAQRLKAESDRRCGVERKLADAEARLEQLRVLIEEERAGFREELSRGADELAARDRELARLRGELAAVRKAEQAAARRVKRIERSRSYRAARRVARASRAVLSPALAIRRRARRKLR
jgi:SAM-dependent methyltransferase